MISFLFFKNYIVIHDMTCYRCWICEDVKGNKLSISLLTLLNYIILKMFVYNTGHNKQ